jgi:hypothetical protein
VKRIQTIVEKYGNEYLNFIPRYNLNSIMILDKISEQLNIKIQHALNGGEKIFSNFFIDGYIEKYNICIEWNEKYHYTKKNIEKDNKRKQYIIDNFGCEFIEINENVFIKNENIEFKKIINKIKLLIS